MIAGFVREAIKKSWNSEIMENSWSSTGMWPLDPSKSLMRQAVSNDPAPSSFSAPFVLTNDPLPIANIKPRDMLRLKRQGVDVSLYRAIGITQRRLNSITPTKPPKDLHYVDLTPKRLLTNAECMAARRLKENELEDQRREKAERKRQIVAKREAKQREQEAKRIEILVKKRLRAIEEEQKKIEREMKKAEKAAQEKKQEEDKHREREEKRREREDKKRRKAEELQAKKTETRARKAGRSHLQVNFNMGHMAEARVLNPNISATTEAFGAYKVSATTQSSGLDDGAAPASLCATPVLQQPIVYLANL